MTKKGPLSKAEKFYIEHNHKEADLESMCKDLDRAKSIVKTHIEKCKKLDKKTSKLTSKIGTYSRFIYLSII